MVLLFRCNECLRIFPETQIFKPSVPHPKTGEPVALSQCPECGECNDFTNICDTAWCAQEAGNEEDSTHRYLDALEDAESRADSLARELEGCRRDYLAVCEALFGCFVVGTSDPGTNQCAVCGIQIDITKWTTAPHYSDCIIPKVAAIAESKEGK